MSARNVRSARPEVLLLLSGDFDETVYGCRATFTGTREQLINAGICEGAWLDAGQFGRSWTQTRDDQHGNRIYIGACKGAVYFVEIRTFDAADAHDLNSKYSRKLKSIGPYMAAVDATVAQALERMQRPRQESQP